MRALRKLKEIAGGETTVATEMEESTSEVSTAGIIGCGEITSRVRARSLIEAENVELAAVMDVREWAAEEIGDRFDVEATSDESALLSDPSIDFVYVATPHHLHAEQVERAADAGKNVVVEKPLATSLDDATAAIEACERNDVSLSVMFPGRFRRPVQRAKELIDRGVIGDLIGTRIQTSTRKTEQYWEGGYSGRIESDWRGQQDRSGGGVLITNNVHDIDEMRYVTGLQSEQVFSQYDSFVSPVEVEDHVVVTVRYENGAIGTIESSSCLDIVPGNSTEWSSRVYGERGTICFGDSLHVYTTVDTEFGEPDTWHEVDVERRSALDRSVEFFESFSAALIDGREPPVTGEDGRAALETVLAAYRSGRLDEPVELPLKPTT